MNDSPTDLNRILQTKLDDLAQRLPEDAYIDLLQSISPFTVRSGSFAEFSKSKILQGLIRFIDDLDQILPQEKALAINEEAQSSKIQLLQKLPLFQTLSNTELAPLAAILEERDIPSGENLLIEGKKSEMVYFIKQGGVEILVGGELVAQRKEGDSIGEMSCLRGDEAASATVRAKEVCHVWQVSHDHFLKAINRLPQLWRTIFIEMTNRFTEASQRKSDLLQHSTEGLVLVNQRGCITDEYSSKCMEYFGLKELTGKKFADLLQNPEHKKQWDDIFPLFFEGNLMGVGSIASLLPKEISYQQPDGDNYIFKLSFYPCKGIDQNLKGVDIGIQDVTAERELDGKREALEQERAIQQKIYHDPEAYLQLLDLYDKMALELKQIQQTSPRGNLKIEPNLLRKLHTLKGINAMFWLEEGKRCCHELETLFIGLVDEPGNLDLTQFNQLHENFGKQADFAKHMLDNLGEELKARLTGRVISPDEFSSLKELVETEDIAGLKGLLERLESISARKLVESWPDEIDRLSRDMNKKIKFKVQGEPILISPRIYNELAPVLIHLLRNGVDHGIETGEIRHALGKDDFGRIEVTFDRKDQNLEMIIQDDGHGIDTDVVIEKARSNPNLSSRQVEKLIALGKPMRLLFLPGFSTKEAVSDTSGRGVGMNAIISSVEQLGGSIRIKTNYGAGTIFTLSIPLA